jgi:hypothetical protein
MTGNLGAVVIGLLVMPALVAGIHDLLLPVVPRRDGWDKPGHDDLWMRAIGNSVA